MAKPLRRGRYYSQEAFREKRKSKQHGSVCRLKEPIRSAYTPAEVSELARGIGWETIQNSGIEDWKTECRSSFSLNEKEVGMQWLERIWIGVKK
jgi:hypothetical protein